MAKPQAGPIMPEHPPEGCICRNITSAEAIVFVSPPRPPEWPHGKPVLAFHKDCLIHGLTRNEFVGGIEAVKV